MAGDLRAQMRSVREGVLAASSDAEREAAWALAARLRGAPGTTVQHVPGEPLTRVEAPRGAGLLERLLVQRADRQLPRLVDAVEALRTPFEGLDDDQRAALAQRVAELGDDVGRLWPLRLQTSAELVLAAAAEAWWGAPLPGPAAASTVVAVRSRAGGRAGPSSSMGANVVSVVDAARFEPIDLDPASALQDEVERGRLVLVLRRRPLVGSPPSPEPWVAGPDAATVCASTTWAEAALGTTVELRVWTSLDTGGGGRLVDLCRRIEPVA